jgi:hypothetical protein
LRLSLRSIPITPLLLRSHGAVRSGPAEPAVQGPRGRHVWCACGGAIGPVHFWSLMSGGCPARSGVGLRLRFRLCARRALRARRGWQKCCDNGRGEPVLVGGLGPASADNQVEVVARADVSGPGSESRDGSSSERGGGDEHRDGGPAPGWLVAAGWCAGHVGVVPVRGSVMAVPWLVEIQVIGGGN